MLPALPALIVALPFAGAVLPPVAGRMAGSAAALAAAVVSAFALALLVTCAPSVLAGNAVSVTFAWVPTLGLDAAFRIDGLGLMFAGMILFIGLLVILYARAYLADDADQGRFFALLLVFQGSMLGIVLSDNLLMMLVFWEATSLASFLLIGSDPQNAAARQGARTALAVTGAGGLALMAGFLLLGGIAGTYRISDLVARSDVIAASDAALPALLLILVGAFTKSAQVPFHFWLPGAMAAPTPVSAYLHSATMVKAGIFLLARLWPALSGLPEWEVLVAGAGLLTMTVGAAAALLQTDLKALLAWSTVSHLGLITMLLGFGTQAGVIAAMAHILAHATFKAALFMVAGIVAHQTRRRDLRSLGGLSRAMPVTTLLAVVAGLAMAGVPPLNGYLTKEMMLAAAAEVPLAGNGWVIAAAATVAAALSVGYTLRFVLLGFFGQRRTADPAPAEAGIALWAAPAVLAALALASGIAPMALSGGLIGAAANAVTKSMVVVDIVHWHGIAAPALWMSLAAWGGGIAAFGALAARHARGSDAPPGIAERAFDTVVAALTGLARLATRHILAPSPSQSLALALGVVVAAGALAFATGAHAPGSRPPTPAGPAAIVALVLLASAAAGTALVYRDRFSALVMMGLVGLIVSMGFAALSAPDLALTQILVDVVTVLLLLLALGLLPRRAQAASRPVRRLRDALLASAAGLGAGALSLALMTREAAFAPVSAFHALNAKPQGGGTNIVNVILVDFRGFDTFGEMTVLGIAALTVHAATRGLLTPGPARDRLRALHAARTGAGERHPLILSVVARLLLPLMLLVGVFLLLRGHNLPGGGFIAGLVFAVAFLMRQVASGSPRDSARIDPAVLLGGGMLLAAATGAGAFWYGLPFLTSDFGYLDLPLLDPVELATATLFDLGVFLTVLGSVLVSMTALTDLSQPVAEPPSPLARDR